jgi:hypothetical protein
VRIVLGIAPRSSRVAIVMDNRRTRLRGSQAVIALGIFICMVASLLPHEGRILALDFGLDDPVPSPGAEWVVVAGVLMLVGLPVIVLGLFQYLHARTEPLPSARALDARRNIGGGARST